VLCDAFLSADALPDHPDFRLSRRGLKPGCSMRLGNGCDPPLKCARSQSPRTVRKIVCNRLGCCRHRMAAVSLAPRGKIGPVRAVGFPGVLRLGFLEEISRELLD